MAERGDLALPRVDLKDIEPPWRQTDVAWKAIKEGVQEIYTNDYDGKGNNAIVVIPHRLQATFVCGCGTSMVIIVYAADALRGHIAMTKRCTCGNSMRRKFIGAERDIPFEERAPKREKTDVNDVSSDIQTTFDDFIDEQSSEIDDEDIVD